MDQVIYRPCIPQRFKLMTKKMQKTPFCMHDVSRLCENPLKSKIMTENIFSKKNFFAKINSHEIFRSC